MTNFNTGYNDDQFARRTALTQRGYTILAIATRSDGYMFYLVRRYSDDKPTIWAGCKQNYTQAEYRRHIRASHSYRGRAGRWKTKETLAILDLFKLVA